jgi:FkbM family methyltransferase
MLNTLHRWLLYVLCRHCTQWRGVWRLDLLRRVQQYRFPTEGTILVRTKWGLPIEVRKHDFLGRILYFFGDFERKLLRAAEKEIRPAGTVLDIGANIGAVTMYLCQLVDRAGLVYCVEPHAENFALLEKNLQRVGFRGRVVAERCALGAEEKTVALHFDAQSDNWGTVSVLADSEAGVVEEVPMLCLDTLWKREWLRPQFDFVKLDVEGYEWEVLQGATEMLRENPPRVWVVEFNMDYLQRTEQGVRRLWDFFLQRGYQPCSMETGEKMLQPPEAHCDVLFRLEQ